MNNVWHAVDHISYYRMWVLVCGAWLIHLKYSRITRQSKLDFADDPEGKAKGVSFFIK